MIGCVPPSHWSNLWKVDPEKLVRLAAAGDWAELLHQGWGTAAAAFGDTAWAEPLLRDGAGTTDATALTALLPPARREEAAMQRLAGRKAKLSSGKDGMEAIHILSACRHPWSRAFTMRMLEVLRATAEGDYDWSAVTVIPELALHADPGCADAVAQGWPEEAKSWPAWRNSIDRFAGLLRFRKDMHEALQEKT
jgi:hypothetical protein